MGRVAGQVSAAGTNKKNLWFMTPELKQDRTSTKMMAKVRVHRGKDWAFGGLRLQNASFTIFR